MQLSIMNNTYLEDTNMSAIFYPDIELRVQMITYWLVFYRIHV